LESGKIKLSASDLADDGSGSTISSRYQFDVRLFLVDGVAAGLLNVAAFDVVAAVGVDTTTAGSSWVGIKVFCYNVAND
jgi:hypothetical protein